MAYKSITLDDDLLKEIEEWAARPDQNRSLSNAVETLCKMALQKIKEDRR